MLRRYASGYWCIRSTRSVSAVYERAAADFIKDAIRHRWYRRFTPLAHDTVRSPFCEAYCIDNDLLPDHMPSVFDFSVFQSPGVKLCVIDMCSNDYLNLATHKKVVEAAIQAIQRYGAGAHGTRNIAGTSPDLLRLEASLAAMHKTDASLVFNSAYMCNSSIFHILGQLIPSLVFLSDAQNHASIVDGLARFSIHQRKFIFKHNDVTDLEKIMKSLELNTPKCIICESVYSTTGWQAPLKTIAELAVKYNAVLCVDEVHAIGLYGPLGGGLVQALGLERNVDLIVGTMGKSLGTVGGYCAGNRLLLDCIRLAARGFIFTTSLPPSVVASALTSVQLITDREVTPGKCFCLASYFRSLLQKHSIPFLENEATFIPVMIGCGQKCYLISHYLLQNGFYCQAFNYPSVPIGTERLRICIKLNHSKDMLERLVSVLADGFRLYDIYETGKRAANLVRKSNPALRAHGDTATKSS